jgi:hypothetical protein
MHYANLDTYLRDADLTASSALPIPVVARWMAVTPPAVRAMLRRGVLEAISIGPVTFVAALSLRAWQVELEAEVRKASKHLQKAARKSRPLSYSDLLAKLGRDHQKPADRRRLGTILRGVSSESLLENGVLLAVWAQSKATEMPKHGVWDLADDHGLRRDGEGPKAFVDRQRAAATELFSRD